jgi:hypothetical protein
LWVIWNAKVSRESAGYLEHHNKYEESVGKNQVIYLLVYHAK